MSHWTYVALAYAFAILTIGGVAWRIIYDYRKLRAELAQFGDRGRREEGDAA